MIVDGNAVAEELYAALKLRRVHFKRLIRLGIVVGSKDPAIESFVRIKARAARHLDVEIVRVDLSLKAKTKYAIETVRDLSGRTDGIIVQLPLPAGVDANAVLSEIPRDKDVDAINPVFENNHAIEAPVALAVVEILNRSNVPTKGKRVVVVGDGRLVGAPTALLLKKLGADVSKFTLHGGSIDDLKDADIVVCGAGNPGFIKPEHLKKGVVLIDAGTSESAGKVVGDADPACAEKASVFTPVPGGVGPIAVAMIFKNLFDLVEKHG